MKLTQRQLDVLNHVVVNGQEWADNAEKVFDAEKAKEAMLAKVAKYESEYDEEVAKGNYKTRKQRDDAETKVKKDEYDNAPYSEKRRREYPSTGDQLDYIFHHGVEKWKEDMIIPVKNKYPKE